MSLKMINLFFSELVVWGCSTGVWGEEKDEKNMEPLNNVPVRFKMY